MTMNKIFYILPILALLFCACQESDEAGEYDNWPSRNQHYVDSIAALADAGTDGWTKMIAFDLISTDERPDLNTNHYIYVKKLEAGTGDRKPEFNDSIRIHYLGRFIPTMSYPEGRVFGKSYTNSTPNEAIDVPALMAVNANVTGIATAVMNMVEGDKWKIVVPSYLGYGSAGYTSASVPGSTTLIFDVKLARIYKYKIDTDTTWH